MYKHLYILMSKSFRSDIKTNRKKNLNIYIQSFYNIIDINRFKRKSYIRYFVHKSAKSISRS